MIAKLRNNFFAGLLVVLPLVLTVFILTFIVGKVNLLLNPLTVFLKNYVIPYFPEKLVSINVLSVMANLFVFIGLIGVVVVVGFMTRMIVVRKMIAYGEDLLYRLPLVNKVYSTIRQISQAFLGSRKNVFQKAVMLEYPRKGIYSIGFLTGQSSGEIQVKIKSTVFNVFVPTTPNPTSGVFLIVPEKELTFLEMTVEEAIKLVISGGAVTPEYKNIEQ